MNRSHSDVPFRESPLHPSRGLADRRAFLRLAAGAAAAGLTVPHWAGAAEGVAAGPKLVRFPEKTDLILLTDRPPNLETPLRFFREDFTPNEAFYVRWHLAILP